MSDRDRMEFVPDAEGGHLRSVYGDKWYPEEWARKKIAEAEARFESTA